MGDNCFFIRTPFISYFSFLYFFFLVNLSCIISILGRVFFLENKLSANYREEICCKVSRLRYTSFLLEMNRKGEVKSMCFCYSKVSWQISPLLSLLIEFRSYLNHSFCIVF